MDMSGMASMGGMDMSSSGLFTAINKSIAHGYWYAIAGVTSLLTLTRIANALEARRRLREHIKKPHSVASRPRNVFAQAYATATTIFRELSYAQPIYFTGRVSKYFSPLPIGRWVLLAIYWTMILTFLWTNVILKPSDAMYAYKWEKVGFRAAWVSSSQIPFIYLLSSKFNPISLLTGISYERINWLHRWAARTVFLTAIVHWSFFLREWWLADFVQLEIQMMPMVKYGFGAFGTISWMVLSGFGFFRAVSYELFVAQHICAAIVLLWLLFNHVPSYARYNVYMTFAFMAFDWSARIVWNIIRNTHLLGSAKLRAPGYSVRLQELPGNVVRLVVEDADFSWKAAQHAFLSIPRLRPFELHPFTIANSCEPDNGRRKFTMLIKAHSGFSKSLHKAAVRSMQTGRTYRAFLSGPWGIPPALSHYETVVLIACSTGASFTTPLLEGLVRNPGCVRKVTLHWIIRYEEHFKWFGETLRSLVNTARESGLSLLITVHVTRSQHGSSQEQSGIELKEDPGKMTVNIEQHGESISTEAGDSSSSAGVSLLEDEKSRLSPNGFPSRPRAALSLRHGSRPTVESMVRPPVEAALGETAVVVCGGLAITAQTRTFVAALSDERAVHKGTGAQGIFLFSETYGW
jgi:hypothetical protein